MPEKLMRTTTPMQFATPINTIQQVTEKRGESKITPVITFPLITKLNTDKINAKKQKENPQNPQ